MSSMTPALQASIAAAAILARQQALVSGQVASETAMGVSAATQFIAALNVGTAVVADAWLLLKALRPDNFGEALSSSFVATLAASH